MTGAADPLEEQLDIYANEDGVPIARGTWGDYVFEEELPRGIGTWPDDQMRAHLTRFVVPRLKFLIGKAKAGRFTAKDVEALEAAKAKREKKAAKLRVVT